MAKKKRDPLGDFAEDVGRLLGTTERKASEWLSQRTVVATKTTIAVPRCWKKLSADPRFKLDPPTVSNIDSLVLRPLPCSQV